MRADKSVAEGRVWGMQTSAENRVRISPIPSMLDRNGIFSSQAQARKIHEEKQIIIQLGAGFEE